MPMASHKCTLGVCITEDRAMKASLVDLRRRSRDIIRALERNESVTVFYRGKPKAIMRPLSGQGEAPRMTAQEHPAFGLWADREDLKNVAARVRQLRRGRLDAV